jgi:hypothetical protein
MAMDKQMELFEDGGLMDEGGTLDPVSGNEVPPGSTQEEVRDDIPAQLSEGEFVFPADVVRYFGLEKLMEMRQEAKQGLQRMEDMGQMGNSEEAVLPDNIPFDLEDLDMEDEEEQAELNFAVGGTVPMPGFTGIGGYQPPPAPTTGFAPAPTVTAPVQAASAQPAQAGTFQPAGTSFTPTTVQTAMPTFQETIGAGVPNVDFEYVDYVNDAGQIIRLKKSKSTGELLEPVPEGYRPVGDGGTAPTTTDPTRVETTQTGGDSGRDVSVPTTTGTVSRLTGATSTMSDVGGFLTKDIQAHANAFGGHKVFGIKNEAMRNATLNQAKYQLGSISPMGAIGSALAKEFGFTEATMNDMAVAGQQAKEAALTTLGFTRSSQLQTSDQATMYGNMISAAHEAAKKGQDVSVALAKEMNKPAYAEAIKGSAVSALQGLGYTSDKITDAPTVGRAIAGYRAAADAYRQDAEATRSSGTVRDSKGNPVTTKSGVVMTQSARDRMNAELEAAATAEAKANALAAERARQSGNVGRDDGVIGEPTARDVTNARSAAAQATREAEAAGRDYGDEFGNIADDTSSLDSMAAAEAQEADEAASGGKKSGQSSGNWNTTARHTSTTKSDSGSDSSGDKIVCTAMNNAYGFGSFRQTVWLQHSKNMDPAYQKGYHRIFKPLIKFAYADQKWYNMFVRSTLEGIARRRTADIWMQKHGKRHLRGAIERTILEPLCYIVGKIK